MDEIKKIIKKRYPDIPNDIVEKYCIVFLEGLDTPEERERAIKWFDWALQYKY